MLAGGQSLGPMLNLRLAQPRLLVQVNRLPELCGVATDADAVTIGACVTHSAIADGLVPDIGGGVLARVADVHRVSRGAQSRHDRRQPVPCRSRGGLGHGADRARCERAAARPRWCAPSARRRISSRAHSAPRCCPARSCCATSASLGCPATRAGRYEKACRKPGDFAHAMAAVLLRGDTRRVVIGALGGRPLLLEGDAAIDRRSDAMRLQACRLDPVQRHMQLAGAATGFRPGCGMSRDHADRERRRRNRRRGAAHRIWRTSCARTGC